MPPPFKRRKVVSQGPEEITFDDAARSEYLTGFHKRKQARIKHAQEVAAKKEKEEKIRDRREMRQRRQEELEEHVKAVNLAVNQYADIRDGETSGWEDDKDEDEQETFEGFGDLPEINREDEYIDEDKYTTVTVETVDITRQGFLAPGESNGVEPRLGGGAKDDKAGADTKSNGDKKKVWTKEKPKVDKKKKRKFRYEPGEARREAKRAAEKEKAKKQGLLNRGHPKSRKRK